MTIRRFAALVLAVMLCLGVNGVFAEQENEAYQQVLERAQMALGNNLRLKNVLERAAAGENITVALIGGSITEGAGAANYSECYAMRVGDGLRERFGENINVINAGVGGTPSTFGWIRYARDVEARVPETDPDGLPDIVFIEFSVNDWGEPTNHQCYESMVKAILEQPNHPAVILVFAVFKNGWNLQDDLKKVGQAYDLMMVSIRDGAYPAMDDIWTKAEWFSDDYHPTSLGHQVMADCILGTIDAAVAAPTAEQDIDLDVKPAFGLGYMKLRRIFASDKDLDGIALQRGSFNRDDQGSYRNYPVGRVCGQNFSHTALADNDPLSFTATFSKLMIGWRTANGFGSAEVLIDGKVVRTLTVPSGSWGQTEVTLVLNDKEAAEHTVEIRMAEDSLNKQFTVTCMAFAE